MTVLDQVVTLSAMRSIQLKRLVVGAVACAAGWAGCLQIPGAAAASAAPSKPAAQQDPAEFALMVQRAVNSQDLQLILDAISTIWGCAKLAHRDAQALSRPVTPLQIQFEKLIGPLNYDESDEPYRRLCLALDEHSRAQWPSLMARALQMGEPPVAAYLFATAAHSPSANRPAGPPLPFTAAMLATGLPFLLKDAQACDKTSLDTALWLSERHPGVLSTDEKAAYRLVLKGLGQASVETPSAAPKRKSLAQQQETDRPPPVENPAAVAALAAAIRAKC